ncbi:MAG: cytochrome P460 family protein [Terracidiphilus sp.]
MSLKIVLPIGSLLLIVCLCAGPRPELLQASAQAAAKADAPSAPAYTQDGRLLYPARYREWVFLSSGVDMSYNPKAIASGQTVFDNVFVNPEAYAKFLQTGAWPDKTVLVLEARKGMEKGSINHLGHYQGTQVMGVEVHVKDEARFPAKWAFFDFDDQVSGSLFPKDASCYSCHADHAAVDTTFVQFYPTLLPIAQQKQTLSASYLKEEAAAQ